ncbi:DEAD/DEAH box helicase family protein [Synechococcus sp. AH-601-N23]|nr:DEAD/DEAH box helicase family protein [Synechococcus sp. AH-601-N23]
MATFDEFYQSLPEDSNKRGEVFEREFIPWFLREDSTWKNKVAELWLWENYPDDQDKDCGIDLVIEDELGDHYAVQSKCYALDSTLYWENITTFIGASSNPRYKGRILITSGRCLSENARKEIEKQNDFKPTTCLFADDFRRSLVDYPSSWKDLSIKEKAQKPKPSPDPHQDLAIEKVASGFQSTNRGQLLMACGTGKTLTSLWIKEAMHAQKTLVLLPSLSLLSQTLREWTENSREDFIWKCVCSDKSVAKNGKEIDPLFDNTSELGILVTSDPKQVSQFLEIETNSVIFCTYQSSPLIAEAQKDTNIKAFDIVFADEAHRCTGNVSKAFGCVLDDKKIRADKRLFMTATPRFVNQKIKSKADEENIEYASMDDEEQFGRVMHKLDFSEAIKQKLLTDYRVIVMGIDEPEVHAKVISRKLTDRGGDYETLAHHICLAKSVQEYGLERVITFHTRVDSATTFSEEHPEIVEWLSDGKTSKSLIKANYVSGKMNSSEREERIRSLKNIKEGEIGILSNARCLSEGVDVPTLDGIAFIDPKRSQVDIIQAVGRAIRRTRTGKVKSYGYIIIPVYLGDTTNIDEDMMISRFKHVWEIILALKSQDDSLTDVIDLLRVELGRRRSLTRREEGLIKVEFKLEEHVHKKIGESLKTILIKNTSDDWLEIYGKLKQYLEDNENYPTGSNDKQLATWLETQRARYRRKTLSRQRIFKLEQLPNWDWEPREGRQKEWVEKIKQFFEDNGHLCIPDKHPELGSIVNMLKGAYTGNRDLKLDESVIKSLDSMKGKGWMWDPNLETSLEKIRFLKEWCIENQSATPSRNVICKGNLRTYSLKAKSKNKSEFNLGSFASKLRVRYRNTYLAEFGQRREKESVKGYTHKGRELSSQEVQACEKIAGWYWDKCEGFARVFAECNCQGIQITNSLRVDFDLIELRGIGNWAKKTKTKQRNNDLDKFEQKILDSLDGWNEYLNYSSR